MRFNDGYWRVRPGVDTAYAASAFEIETTAAGLTVALPTIRTVGRGQTLNTSALTARFWSPAPDIVGVNLSHHGGRPSAPSYPLNIVGGPGGGAQVEVGDDEATVSAGALRARLVLKGPWEVRFEADGRALTASEGKAMGFAEVAGGSHHLLERLDLSPGECIYGLGERFTAFVKNGQSVDMWNADGGSASEQAYKNVPFYLSSQGYGVFVNNPGPVGFEIGSEVASKVQFSVAEHTLEYFVIYGPSPLEVLAKYTALTGRPALPPMWSFGLWLSTSFLTDYDEASVGALVDEMAERKLPLSVFHFDPFWMREMHWCDLEWDERTFPDPQAMLARFHDRGLRVCLWINPYIAERSRLFAEGAAQGFLLRRPGGEVWQIDDWQPGIGIVDFTNPGACAWFANKLKRLLAMGVDCFKTDFGERIPTDVEYFDGSDPQRAHNFFSFLYNRTVFEAIASARGPDEAVVFARSATTGGQSLPVHWGGDPESTYVAMAETLRGGLSLASSGFAFWAHDIGGFEGTPPAGLFKRWAAFGLLSSHSRLHGSRSYRAPWFYGDEAVEVVRHFTRLKMQLMPYLYATAKEARQRGAPMLRPMFMQFPHDPACRHLDQQYMLGPTLWLLPYFAMRATSTTTCPPAGGPNCSRARPWWEGGGNKSTMTSRASLYWSARVPFWPSAPSPNGPITPLPTASP